MPLSVLTASLGKNLLPLYLMSGIPQICPYWSKSLKHHILYKLALEVQTIFLNQTTWYLAIHLTTANMKCSGPLSAPALFQASVRQPRTMFWRFEISQSISCFVFFVNGDHMIIWVNDDLQKWIYRPIKVEMTCYWSVGEIWKMLNFSFRFCPPSKMRKTAGWPVKTSTCAPTTPSWAQKTLWGEPIQKVVTRRFAHCMLSPLFDKLNLNEFDRDWDHSVICSISS